MDRKGGRREGAWSSSLSPPSLPSAVTLLFSASVSDLKTSWKWGVQSCPVPYFTWCPASGHRRQDFFFCSSNSIFMPVPHFLYAFIYWWTLCCSHGLAVVKNAAVNTGMLIPLRPWFDDFVYTEVRLLNHVLIIFFEDLPYCFSLTTAPFLDFYYM